MRRILWWCVAGEEGEAGGDRPQEGRGEEADGGGLQSQEGQERFHDPREEEETEGEFLDIIVDPRLRGSLFSSPRLLIPTW